MSSISVAVGWCSPRRAIVPSASAEKQRCMSDTSYNGRRSSGLYVLEETLIIMFKAIARNVRGGTDFYFLFTFHACCTLVRYIEHNWYSSTFI